MLAVYLAASTTLSTSLSLHAGRLRRPAELSRVEDAGPRPILSETFFNHLRTWELENDFFTNACFGGESRSLFA